MFILLAVDLAGTVQVPQQSSMPLNEEDEGVLGRQCPNKIPKKLTDWEYFKNAPGYEKNSPEFFNWQGGRFWDRYVTPSLRERKARLNLDKYV